MFKDTLNIPALALDILLLALVDQGVNGIEDETKIYRVHFKDGTSKLVAAKSGQGLMGLYAQRVSPK